MMCKGGDYQRHLSSIAFSLRVEKTKCGAGEYNFFVPDLVVCSGFVFL